MLATTSPCLVCAKEVDAASSSAAYKTIRSSFIRFLLTLAYANRNWPTAGGEDSSPSGEGQRATLGQTFRTNTGAKLPAQLPSGIRVPPLARSRAAGDISNFILIVRPGRIPLQDFPSRLSPRPWPTRMPATRQEGRIYGRRSRPTRSCARCHARTRTAFRRRAPYQHLHRALKNFH